MRRHQLQARDGRSDWLRGRLASTLVLIAGLLGCLLGTGAGRALALAADPVVRVDNSSNAGEGPDEITASVGALTDVTSRSQAAHAPSGGDAATIGYATDYLPTIMAGFDVGIAGVTLVATAADSGLSRHRRSGRHPLDL